MISRPALKLVIDASDYYGGRVYATDTDGNEWFKDNPDDELEPWSCTQTAEQRFDVEECRVGK